MARYLRLNLTGNGYLVPALGYPLRLGAQSQAEARGVTPRSISSVSATVKADRQADLHLALYCTPLTRGGDDSELLVQVDAAGVLSSYQTITVSPPASLAGVAFAPTGTITISASSQTVTGSSTAFPADGQWNGYELQVKNGAWYQIASVQSATSLTLSNPAASIAAGAGAFYVRRPVPGGFVVRLWADNIQGGLVETVKRDSSVTSIPGQAQAPLGVTVSSIVVS